jgi:hypothetical protein
MQVLISPKGERGAQGSREARKAPKLVDCGHGRRSDVRCTSSSRC